MARPVARPIEAAELRQRVLIAGEGGALQCAARDLQQAARLIDDVLPTHCRGLMMDLLIVSYPLLRRDLLDSLRVLPGRLSEQRDDRLAVCECSAAQQRMP